MTQPLFAGVELGGTKCICILATGPDDVREEVTIPTTRPDETLPAIEAVLDRWRDFAALGIASFGPVVIDRALPEYGSIAATPKPGWAHAPLAPRLGQRYGVPIGFDTDVVGAALAEGRWGAAMGLDDFAYATVGTGIGVGLIAGGRPVSGMTHSEFGHVRIARLAGDSFAGTCPFHGDCCEGLASGPSIQARTGIPGPELPSDHPAWNTVAHALAQLCHTLVLTGVPRRIVMGGGVMLGEADLFPRIRTRLRESLAGYIETAPLADMDGFVVPPALAGRAGPLGAIVLAEQALAATGAP
ncbi:ROK family protein [Sphingomonas aracearum]|uniref:fructokinase n=1 Tax=Sphingomonas aracearum TaxID=2283317 RepID=A0A369VZB9_9SPHN|nr:ROK family protein [Sphingomonas aracearum]RDE06987.1 ROK family protein [Sphingomonas aracearum]